MSRRTRRTKSPPFVQLFRWVTQTPAWRELDPPARALYLELKERYNGHNNGSIGLGCREATKAINVGPDTASRAFRKLRALGFIEAATASSFSTNGRRATAVWPSGCPLQVTYVHRQMPLGSFASPCFYRS